MYVIGLTGGIACGKSAVSRILAERGIPIVDADVVSRQLVEPGKPLLGELVKAFGDGILRADGSLDRPRLGRLVFSDRDMLRQLNDIMHPAIWRECLRQLSEFLNEPVAVLVAPLLFEHGGESLVQAVWVVGCSENLQMQRLCERDGLSEEQARARMQSQMPLASKLARADCAFDNEGSLEVLRVMVEHALEMLQDKIAAAEEIDGV